MHKFTLAIRPFERRQQI